MLENIKLVLKGGVIGIANIIPGVSGGTMAVVLGVYERLIGAISNFLTDKPRRLEYTIFLGLIAVGAILAIGALSNVMDYLLNEHRIYTHMFFIGLIAGSIPAIYKTHDEMSIDGPSIVSFVVGAGIILAFAVLFADVEKPESVAGFQYQLTTGGIILLLLGGFLAGGSMIVPGISGSLMLLLLGQYRVVIKAIKDLDLVLLGIVAVGAGLGVLGFARMINYCLKHFPKLTFFFILGLVAASLYPIFPGLPENASEIAIAIGLTIAGGAISYFMGER